MKRGNTIRAIAISLAGVLLTSCVAAVVAGAAGMVYDRRSVMTLEADARIFHLVHTAIVTNPSFGWSHVSVTSFNRVVLLVGQTSSSALKTRAEQIAQSTPNVQRVYNELSVGAVIPLSERSKDGLITGQVRSMLLTKKGLESGSIRVVTEDKVVYLMGIVTPEQANLAVDAARRVPGVRKVVKTFQYIR